MTKEQEIRNVLKSIKQQINHIETVLNCKAKEPIGRYIVGFCHNRQYMFYVTDKNGHPLFTADPHMAKHFPSYKLAEACADFIDGIELEVYDTYEIMTPEEKMLLELFEEPEWNTGNENAVPILN